MKSKNYYRRTNTILEEVNDNEIYKNTRGATLDRGAAISF